MKDVKDLIKNIRNNEIAVKEHHDELAYAGIIQQGLFPRSRHFKRIFKDSFYIYQPKKLVSGDFYWISEKNGIQYFACADCTGHGIPAALVSVLGYSLLNYALFNASLNTPSEILKRMDEKFIESFDFEGNSLLTNDWIDISLCAYDPLRKKLTFCGANRKVLLISENRSYILPGNRYPIGGWQLEKFRGFDEQSINVKEGDWIYLGSDGYQDQFGGISGKKFGSNGLHALLKSIAHHSGIEQKRILQEHLESWMKNESQTDDICLVGIQLD